MTYKLIFDADARSFRLFRYLKQSAQSITPPLKNITNADPKLVEAFRSCLSSADLAKCTAASIVGAGSQSRVTVPGGRISVLDADNKWKLLGSANNRGR